MMVKAFGFHVYDLHENSGKIFFSLKVDRSFLMTVDGAIQNSTILNA